MNVHIALSTLKFKLYSQIPNKRVLVYYVTRLLGTLAAKMFGLTGHFTKMAPGEVGV